MADATSENIRKRHLERQQKRIRQMKRRRIITVSFLGLLVLLIIIFFTPLFNIRSIAIEGTQRVQTSEIEQCLDKCKGKNIFRYGTGNPIKKMEAIPYVDSASISKSIFSCKITVKVTESTPAAYIEVGEKKVIIDDELKVLEVADSFDGDVPRIIDVSTLEIKPGSTLSLQSEDILNALKTCMAVISAENLLEGIEYISFKDLNSIVFNYQERLDVICGNTDNFERKIKLFSQAISTSTLTENSRGTIDLSVTGQAVYAP